MGLHPGCAQGQGQGQRSCDTDTCNFTKIASSCRQIAGSRPNLHTMVCRTARIHDVLKVKVKGHVTRALLWCHEMFDIQYGLVLSLHALTLWNTIILSFQYKYQAARFLNIGMSYSVIDGLVYKSRSGKKKIKNQIQHCFVHLCARNRQILVPKLHGKTFIWTQCKLLITSASASEVVLCVCVVGDCCQPLIQSAVVITPSSIALWSCCRQNVSTVLLLVLWLQCLHIT